MTATETFSKSTLRTHIVAAARRFMSDCSGSAAIEYVVTAAILAVVVVAA